MDRSTRDYLARSTDTIARVLIVKDRSLITVHRYRRTGGRAWAFRPSDFRECALRARSPSLVSLSLSLSDRWWRGNMWNTAPRTTDPVPGRISTSGYLRNEQHCGAIASVFSRARCRRDTGAAFLREFFILLPPGEAVIKQRRAIESVIIMAAR